MSTAEQVPTAEEDSSPVLLCRFYEKVLTSYTFVFDGRLETN